MHRNGIGDYVTAPTIKTNPLMKDAESAGRGIGRKRTFSFLITLLDLSAEIQEICWNMLKLAIMETGQHIKGRN